MASEEIQAAGERENGTTKAGRQGCQSQNQQSHCRPEARKRGLNVFCESSETAHYSTASNETLQREITLSMWTLAEALNNKPCVERGETETGCVILDLGCGSGFSSRVVAELLEEGGTPGLIIGTDSSLEMLSENERVENGRRRRYLAEVQQKEGPRRTVVQEFVLHSFSQPFPFRENVFKRAVSVSALQWLTAGTEGAGSSLQSSSTSASASSSSAVSGTGEGREQSFTRRETPSRRLVSFFEGLSRLLPPSRKLSFQFYPENNDKAQAFVKAAAETEMFSSEGSGLMMAYPHRTSARKWFLCLSRRTDAEPAGKKENVEGATTLPSTNCLDSLHAEEAGIKQNAAETNPPTASDPNSTNSTTPLPSSSTVCRLAVPFEASCISSLVADRCSLGFSSPLFQSAKLAPARKFSASTSVPPQPDEVCPCRSPLCPCTFSGLDLLLERDITEHLKLASHLLRLHRRLQTVRLEGSEGSPPSGAESKEREGQAGTGERHREGGAMAGSEVEREKVKVFHVRERQVKRKRGGQMQTPEEARQEEVKRLETQLEGINGGLAAALCALLRGRGLEDCAALVAGSDQHRGSSCACTAGGLLEQGRDRGRSAANASERESEKASRSASAGSEDTVSGGVGKGAGRASETHKASVTVQALSVWDQVKAQSSLIMRLFHCPLVVKAVKQECKRMNSAEEQSGSAGKDSAQKMKNELCVLFDHARPTAEEISEMVSGRKGFGLAWLLLEFIKKSPLKLPLESFDISDSVAVRGRALPLFLRFLERLQSVRNQKRGKGVRLQSFAFGENSMGPPEAPKIFPLLLPCLESLSLKGNLLGLAGFRGLAEALRAGHGSFLRSLDLERTGLNKEGLETICEAITQTPLQHLETLNLSQNDLSNSGMSVLCHVLSVTSLPHLRVLLLRDCGFGSAEMHSVAQVLEEGRLPKLESLDLEGNEW
uniref:Methyltransferase domain-containing protein n=1 Tax=Chromera velia CCMP2878 TaxID=1169474 RepID=A0A0G4HAP6_9ALVE|eukprot:Cvel_6126.t1-p1 / transcript=Cvel_6126.t1 / gene=Cvel_6126 / organism=Chromera_velia_CCMP2878 / gene_product=Putative methyltransferase BUD23, putative / transcript_product=Putative methyltransferase BUD23, putative / location=Cvel_scaffold296:1277-8172(+) / protein_length=944 / sequence_SO=supercontig / SO=protein_coding / is_pseudo=false